MICLEALDLEISRPSGRDGEKTLLILGGQLCSCWIGVLACSL